MRLLIITLAAVATALGTSYGLHLLFPIDTSVEVDRNLVTAEEVLDRPLKPAPLPSGRLLMPADETVIDVTPPEQGQLSEDMSAPDADLAGTTTPEDDSSRLTEDALRLAALADAEADATNEVPAVDAAEQAEQAESSAVESESATAAAADPAAEASAPPADTEVAQAGPAPTAGKAPTATPAPSKAPPVPTATATPKPAPSASRSPRPEPTRTAVDAPAGPPGSASPTLASGKPLAPQVIAPSSHDIDARSRPTAPAPTAAPPALRRPAPRPPPPQTPAQDDSEADAWWLRPTTPSQLGVVHVGTAGFNRAIVLITDGGFNNVESLARNVEVLRGGIVIEGQWSLSPANDHLAIFPLVHAGDYDITVGAGLQDRNGRVWPHTVRGTISVP